MNIELSRSGCSGFFETDDYTVHIAASMWGGEYNINPKLCAGSTSRLFKLGRGCNNITAVFLKRPPRKYKGRFYTITPHAFGGSSLEEFKGSFMQGVRRALFEQYKLGYRYVYITRA